MGCGSTKRGPATAVRVPDSDFQTMIRRVQTTWSPIKKIDNLGPKTFAHLLHVYPILKRISHVSPTFKTEADLLRANEVRDLGNMLLALYSDIIKNADVNLDERIRNKAIVLNRQGIKPRLIQHFGESLFYIATHQMNIKLTQQEKQAWENFTDYVSTHLTAQMAIESNGEPYV